MLIRIILVGIVASLGLELPSGQDVSSWTNSSRGWVNARMADLSNVSIEAGCTVSEPTVVVVKASDEPAPASASTVGLETTKTTNDPAFEAVSNEIANEFRADLVATRSRDADLQSPTMVVQAEPTTTTISVALPDGEEAATAAPIVTVEVTAPVVVVAVPAVVCEVEEDDESPSRLDQLNHAVKLTRDAVQAWSTLLQDSAEDVGLTH